MGNIQNIADRTKFLVAAFFLFLSILFIYHPSFHFDFIGLDDNDFIVRNPDIKGFTFDCVWRLLTRPYLTLYIPVTMLSYFVDYQLWYLTAFGFRFTNVVIHFLNSLLVLIWVKKLTKNFLIACSSAFIFAVHPIQIESVAWIAERKNVLSTFFFFPALIFYWNAAKQSVTATEERKWLFFSLLAYVLALLSKPSVIIFFPMIFAINYFLCDGSHRLNKRWWFYGAVLAMSALAGFMTVKGTAAEVERYAYHGNSFWVTLFVMLTVFWRYAELLFFPFHQNILYSSPAYFSFLQPPVLLSAVALILFFTVVVFFRKRKPLISFWLSWFFIALLPVSNIVAPLPSIMNDRYLYVPMVGFFTAFFLFLREIFPRFIFDDSNHRGQVSTAVCIAMLAIPFMVLTTQRLPDWKDATSLWEAAFKQSPRKDPRIFYFAAINEIDRGNYQRAILFLKESLATDPTIDTRLALGTAYVAAGKFDEAEPELKKVIELDPKRAGAHDQLGVAYRNEHRYEESEKAFKKALTIAPRSAIIHNNYALLLMDQERSDDARKEWEYALKLDPDCHFALRNLAWFHFMRNEFEPAAFYVVRYLRRDPHDRQMRNLAKTIQDHLDQAEQKQQ